MRCEFAGMLTSAATEVACRNKHRRALTAVIFGAWAVVGLFGRPGYAAKSLVNVYGITGKEVSGFGTRALLNTNRDPLEPLGWGISLGYEHRRSEIWSLSERDTVSLGVSYRPKGSVQVLGGFVFSEDLQNDLRHWGPTFTATYFKKAPGGGAVRPSLGQLSGDWGSGTDLDSRRPRSYRALPPPWQRLLFRVSLSMELFVYETHIQTSSVTVTTCEGGTCVTRVFREDDGRERDIQFHPTLTIEKPFFGGRLSPFVSAGHYFYSRDPFVIEEFGNPRLNAAGQKLNELNGFLKNNLAVGVNSWLYDGILGLYAAYGTQEDGTTGEWISSREAGISMTLFSAMGIHADWYRSIGLTRSDDTFTGGLSIKF